MGIWLINRDVCNSLYLFLLTIRTAQGLNQMGTPGQRFWKRARVVRLFGAGKTCGLTSRRSKVDHYRRLSAPFPVEGIKNSPSGAIGSRELL